MNDDTRYDGILQVTAFGVSVTPSEDAGTARFGANPVMVRRPVADELPDAFPTEARKLRALAGTRLPATFSTETAANGTWATDVQLRVDRYTGAVDVTRDRGERVVRVRSDEAPMSPVPVGERLPDGIGRDDPVTFRLAIDRGRVVAEDVTPAEQQ